MKIIHCADVHLDSVMNTHLGKEKSKERRRELLISFKRMVRSAYEDDVEAIIIAGDLFDTKKVSATTAREIGGLIESFPGIDFYYLQGNHDKGSFLEGLENVPKNLKIFDSNWKSYVACGDSGSRIVITGIEIDEKNADDIYGSLSLRPEDYNIVILHGQESDGMAKNKALNINLKLLANKNIDYLALGHVHKYSDMCKLDARGQYCYPGCFEGRGFDEAGEHGYVVLDIDENAGSMEYEFIRNQGRDIYVFEVDVTGCNSTFEMAEKVKKVLASKKYSEKSLVKIELVGELSIDAEKNIEYLESQFKDKFYAFKLKDNTKYEVDYNVYELDVSLKGEFIRMIKNDDSLSDEEKAEIIRIGICALKGEDPDETC